MAIEKILTHKNGVAEYIITSKEDLNGLVDVEVGSRARLLNPIEVRDYMYCGKWAEVKREDSYGDNEIEGIIDDINGEIMDNAVETVNEYHKNLDSLVDCTVTEFEGRDITINPSIEGKTKSVMIKGETYQNLVSNKESSYTLTQGTSADRSKLICETSLIKPNTLYTVIFEVTDINLAGTDNISIGVQYSYCNITGKTLVNVKDKGIYMGTFTTGNIVENSDKTFRIKGSSEQWENDTTTTGKTITFKNVVVLEGDYTNAYIPPYFEGIKSIEDVEIKSVGKNLLNLKNISKTYGGLNFVVNNNVVKASGTITNSNGTYDDIIVPISSFPISNGNQVISATGKNSSNIIYQFLVSNENGNNIYSGGYSFKTFSYKIPSGYRLKKIRCLLRTLDAVVDDEFTFQLEESPIATEYQPYQEDKTQILLDEPLMKLPNGVCDTIEQRDDGVYLVKRVGKAVLDGSENWNLTNKLTTNKVYAYYNENVKKGTASITSIICDNFPSTNRNNIINNDVTGIVSGSLNIGFMISIPITEASNLADFKTWLSSNNLTVYYELATPIETKLDVSTVNVTTFKDVTYISTTDEIKPIINVTLDTTNISKDANQYFSIENNKNFILPNMDDIENNSIKELNLYMDIKGEYTLTFPSDIKWSSNVINLNKVDYMSILLKYIKVNDVGLWLGNIRGIKNNHNLVTRYTYFGDDVLPEMPSDYEYTIEYVVNDDGSKTRAIRSVNGTLPSTCSFRGMTTVTDVDYYNVDSNCTSLASIFDGCTSLMNVNFADNIDTSNVTDIKRMFYKCSSLLYLDLSNFNTSKVRDTARMFYGCKSLRNLNLSNLDTSMTTNMTHMFNGCSNLIKLDLSNFNTAKVTNMSNMFQNCSLLKTLDLSNFNTNLVTNIGGMFYNCSSLTSLDLTIFDTGLVTNMGDMFGNCKKISLLDLSSFNTSSIIGISNMLFNVPTTAIIKVSSTFTKTESDCGWSGTFTIVS